MSKLLPYETIVKACEGDPDAVNAVVQHYTGYIRYCSRVYGYYNKDILLHLKMILSKITAISSDGKAS